MEIRWLQDFLAVAETGNFTRAAALRNTSQAAFSRRIQQLEAWIGTPLIDRSILPTQLTAEGERFRPIASQWLTEMLDARAELKGRPAARPDHLRIALPYALATSRFPAWWAEWSRDLHLTASLIVGNIHDLGMALASGEVDLLICFHAAQQPVHPEPERIESLEIETDFLRPFISPALLRRDGHSLPGDGVKPLPLLMYSQGVYFARLVDLIIETAGGLGPSLRVIESDMSDVLRDMAMAGQGIAWLAESTVTGSRADSLVVMGGALWTMPLSIRAFRSRHSQNPAILRLWKHFLRPRSSKP